MPLICDHPKINKCYVYVSPRVKIPCLIVSPEDYLRLLKKLEIGRVTAYELERLKCLNIDLLCKG